MRKPGSVGIFVVKKKKLIYLTSVLNLKGTYSLGRERINVFVP